MKILRNVLKNELNIRTQKDYPIKGVEFIDIMPLIIRKETLKEIIDLFLVSLFFSLKLFKYNKSCILRRLILLLVKSNTTKYISKKYPKDKRKGIK